MAQFAVYRNTNPATRDRFPLLLDVQNDLLAELGTRVVVPLAPVSGMPAPPMTRLMPVMNVDGADYVMFTQQLAGIPRRLLDESVADLSSRRDDVLAALDFLITGY